MVETEAEITRLLKLWSEGDRHALETLIPRVYEELRRIARAHVAREAPGHTLQPRLCCVRSMVRIWRSAVGVVLLLI